MRETKNIWAFMETFCLFLSLPSVGTPILDAIQSAALHGFCHVLKQTFD